MLERWTTVGWGVAFLRYLRPRLAPRVFLPLCAAWLLSLTLALGVVGLAVDVMVLLRAGVSPAYSFFIGSLSAGLAFMLSLLLAPILTIVAGAVHAIADRPSRLRLLWPLPLFLLSLLAGLKFVDAYPLSKHAYPAVVGGATATLFALTLLGRFGSRLWARAIAFVLGFGALAADVSFPRTLYADLHDLASLITVCAALVLATPLRHRMRAWPPSVLRTTVVALFGASLLVTGLGERVMPGWRARAVHSARYQPRLASTLRNLVDFDGDGFSPLAWGGDCDDLDARRNPLAQEDGLGRDLNCNGYALSKHPTPADRGLAPPAGHPDADPGSIDLALLVTIDCWTLDSFTPEVMPRLTEYAKRGVTFTRMYSAGARTHLSLPLLQRPSTFSLPVTARLSSVGVLSTAVVGYYDPELDEVMAGFKLLNPQTYEKPFHPELASVPILGDGEIAAADAQALTNRAIEDLRKSVGQPHYLWIHYFDAHMPYQPRRASERIAAPPGMPPEYGTYLSEVHHIDAELGRILDELDRSGRLQRAVVIVTADHGEGFGRHHIRYHGVSGYEMLIHVPGVFLAPGVEPGVYKDLVSHRDVPPTLLGAFGQVAHVPSAELFGRSWLRLREARQAPLHRFVVSRSSRAVDVSGFVGPIAAIVEGRLKLIQSFEDGLREMYDLVDDPGEEHNIEPEGSIARLRRDLEIYRDLDRYP